MSLDQLKKAHVKIEELEEIITQLKKELTPRLIYPLSWNLTVGESRILTWLFTSTNGFRSKDNLVQFAESVTDRHINGDMMVRKNIHALRTKLRKHGIRIDTRHGDGFELCLIMRKKIKEAVEKELWWDWRKPLEAAQ